VPLDAISGTVDVTVVTGTSQADSAVFATVTDTTTVAPRPEWSIFLPLVLRNYSPLPTDGPDLVITDITIDPASPQAGQPATVYVTVENQGNMDLEYGNNFYVDFYVDNEPEQFEIGDIEWGAQSWWFDVGESHTFSGEYTFTGGTHQLYAQADTDDTVLETNEANNVLGPAPLGVVGVGPGAAPTEPERTPEQNGPRPTPTPGP
jgi:hypothetical protein